MPVSLWGTIKETMTNYYNIIDGNGKLMEQTVLASNLKEAFEKASQMVKDGKISHFWKVKRNFYCSGPR